MTNPLIEIATDTKNIKDGEPFKAHVPVMFKWKPYSEQSTQFKKGRLGRFQECDEYGGWSNTEWSDDQIAQFIKGTFVIKSRPPATVSVIYKEIVTKHIALGQAIKLEIAMLVSKGVAEALDQAGYAIVPKEPTPEIVKAGASLPVPHDWLQFIVNAYSAMIQSAQEGET